MHFVILGAGPAGLQAGAEALAHGHTVTILDPEGLGGNALKHSLLPSKTLIRSSDVLRGAAALGGSWSPDDWSRVMQWQRQRVDAGVRLTQERLQEAHVLREAGHLETPREVVSQETKTRIRGDVVIVASGSRQRKMPGMNPDGARVLMPRVFHELKQLPAEIAILGAGATGLEAASLFARLGSAVHLYFPTASLLPGRDAGIGRRLAQSLTDSGVQLHADRRVTALASEGMEGVRIAWASQSGPGYDVQRRVVLAAGREPVFEREALERLGFDLDAEGFFRVDGNGRTNISPVYAVGDAAGAPLLSNKGWSQGRRAVRHALGLPLQGEPGPTVHAVYTHPEVAWVGEPSPYRYGGELTVPWLYESLLAGDRAPYVLVYTDADDRIVGGECIGHDAAGMMSSVALAITAGLSLSTLAAWQPVSPSSAEWLVWMAREAGRSIG